VALLSLGIFALFPIYIKFFVGADSYLGGLAGLSAIEWVVHLFYPPYVFTFFICGIFTVLGRVLTQRIQGRLDPRLSG
jgi:4-hydroxybenzoate polyprenyltransferase